MNEILEAFSLSIVKHISVVIDNEDCLKNNFSELLQTHQRIINVIIYNYNKKIDFLNSKEFEHIEFILSKQCDFPYFKNLNDLRFLSMNPNIIRYSEALKNNLYYHKKAYIESNGSVYNAPILKQKYGNIFSHSILYILDQSEFQQYWNITKDMIDVCMDCEFRYTCVDNRVPKKNKGSYYFTDNCNYNPYNNTFNEN